jgi:cell division protein FtsI (penicillin-binding protein 3)
VSRTRQTYTAARQALRPAGGARSLPYSSSPLLASKTPPWRSRFVLLLVALAFLVLLGRAVHVQVIASGFYQAEGEKRFVHNQRLPASRGQILDRNGLVLASSVAMPTVQVQRKAFTDAYKPGSPERRELARLLQMRPAELEERVDASTRSFVVLRRHVDERVWEQVRALRLTGVQEVREFQRRYPEGEAAVHVVGRTDIDERGIEGVELGFQDHLQGRRGQRAVLRDRLGQVIEHVGDAALPEHGQDVRLSIDSKVQFFAWQRLRDAVRHHGAAAGSAVVLDARTGEVLALANYPSYDPTRRGPPGEAVRNRALTDVFEPGSTMKPFIAALALETGRARPDTVINTHNGRYTVGGRSINDVHGQPQMTLTEVMVKSSNVGTVKLAMQVPPAEMWALYHAIGMGQRPALEFPGVATGRLRPHKTWRPIEQATMSYGYGLSGSLLQLARAYTVFSTDGQLLPVTLLARDPATGPVEGERVISPRTAQQVRQMLRQSTEPGGTGVRAQALGYSVGGKTGTARKLVGRTYSDKYRAWFVGLAPASDPRIVVAVMVDEPTRGGFYGGQVAAPVFSEIVQQALRLKGVPPDMDVQAAIVQRSMEPAPESF